MVRYSKLQFRTLLRHYNCDLCYTPMILADSFCQSAKARRNEFTTNLFDTPLVTQFAANNMNDFLNAAKIVAPYCDGVDLNCGCPQRWAKQIGIGCVMLEKPELIADVIKQCRNQIPKPFTVSVKMRILKDMRSTVEICRTLDKCGVSFLAVHGRTSSQLTGEVDPINFKLINENISCPLVANGGIRTLEECYKLQALTNCKGVMVANSILTNPMLFSDSEKVDSSCIQNWLDICYNSTLSEYEYTKVVNTKTIAEKPPHLTFQCFHHHLVFMLEKTAKTLNLNLETKPHLEGVSGNSEECISIFGSTFAGLELSIIPHQSDWLVSDASVWSVSGTGDIRNRSKLQVILSTLVI
ncbi:hypothetical protein Trydic_g21864 [Trypoxylus dichotomus]